MYKGTGKFEGFVIDAQKALDVFDGCSVELPVAGNSTEAPFFGIRSGVGGVSLELDLSDAPIFTTNNVGYNSPYTINSKSTAVEGNTLTIRMNITV